MSPCPLANDTQLSSQWKPKSNGTYLINTLPKIKGGA